MPRRLNILFLSSELVPFAKTGGLAEVAGALPVALKRLGMDVRLVLPFYRTVREGDFQVRPLFEDLEIPLGSAKLKANVLETTTEQGVKIYFIEREDLYDRPNFYGSPLGNYYDNLERFTFFANGAFRLAEELSFRPDLIHCHDWQTGLVPVFLKGHFAKTPAFAETRVLFTIHNLGYQGLFPAEKLSVTGIPNKGFFHPEGIEFWGDINLMKAGIIYSDAVTTVSPTYAREIQGPEHGMGLAGVLSGRRDVLQGILNGADYSNWDPARDSHIPFTYSPQQMAGKRGCKEFVIREMGLDPGLKTRPLMAVVSRLDVQKGLDLLVEILDEIEILDVGLVVLGSGDKNIQEAIERVARYYPQRVGLTIGFDDPLAHRIIAGADILLMPSKYEPCGLTQMYALKYGTVPVVRATGGLADTIVPFDRRMRTGNGFTFGPYEPKAFLGAIRQAVDMFKDEPSWNILMANGMKADFSWERSARSYIKVYRSLLKKA